MLLRRCFSLPSKVFLPFSHVTLNKGEGEKGALISPASLQSLGALKGFRGGIRGTRVQFAREAAAANLREKNTANSHKQTSSVIEPAVISNE